MLLALMGMAGGWAGLLAGGLYGWASWVYSYNRDAWMNDSQVKQAHVYQYDNLQIATHSMSRDEVRDRMQATITKLSNYILVTTLVLSLAAEMLVEGNIPESCADFVLNVYMICLGSAMLYLVLSILFGVAASNVVYERSAYLLTDDVPPPWVAVDEAMRIRKKIELTKAFETRSWGEMFKPPLLQSIRVSTALSRAREWIASKLPFGRCRSNHFEELIEEADGEVRQESNSKVPCNSVFLPEAAIYSRQTSPDFSRQTSPDFSEAGYVDEEAGDKNKLGSIELEYDSRWTEHEAMWKPLMKHSGMCAALGFKNLLEAYGYYCMATLYGAYGAQAWTFWAVMIIFTSLNVIIMQFMFRFKRDLHAMLVATGPVACALAATTSWNWLDRFLVPICYSSHCFQSFFIKGADIGREEYFGVGGSDDFCDGGYDSDVHEWRASELLEQVSPTMAENAKGAEDWLQSMSPSEGLLCSTSKLSDSLEADVGEASSTTLTRRASRRLSVEFARENLTGRRASVQPRRSEQAPKLQRLGSEAKRREESRQEALKKQRETYELVKRLMFYARGVVHVLWVFSVVWALQKAAFGAGFKNSNAFFKEPLPAGPPVAGVTTFETIWPSPFFTPRALVCPKGRVFIADEFRVFELTASNRVEPYPCIVDGRIADVTADCNETDCWPIILQANSASIIDCSTGLRVPLLQVDAPAERFAELDDSTMYASHEGRVVQYQWAAGRGGWAPYWAVADVGKGNLRAIDVVGSRLLIFSNGIVEVRNLDDAKTCGIWNLPHDVVGAGCAVEGGTAVLLLGHLEGDTAGSNVRLMCAELAGPQSCGSSPPANGDQCRSPVGNVRFGPETQDAKRPRANLFAGTRN